MPTEAAIATIVCESRRLASERLAAAAELHQGGDEAAAAGSIRSIAEARPPSERGPFGRGGSVLPNGAANGG